MNRSNPVPPLALVAGATGAVGGRLVEGEAEVEVLAFGEGVARLGPAAIEGLARGA